MLSDDLADFLTSGGISSGAIFIGEAPEKPSLALVVTPTGGPGTERTMDAASANAPVERERVQLRVRGDDWDDAESLMRQAHVALRSLSDRAINGRRYYTTVAVQTPFYLGRDENNRAEFACNYDVFRAEATG